MQRTETINSSNNFCLKPAFTVELDTRRAQRSKTHPRALLLVNSEANSPDTVAKLKRIEGVNEVHPIKGMYDFAVLVQAPSFEKLRKEVLHNIRKIANIKNTLTLTLVDS